MSRDIYFFYLVAARKHENEIEWQDTKGETLFNGLPNDRTAFSSALNLELLYETVLGLYDQNVRRLRRTT